MNTSNMTMAQNNIDGIDKFFIWPSAGEIVWIYHNSDANSGDQFVTNFFDYSLLKQAIEECQYTGDVSDIFDHIGSECRQYCSDKGDTSYKWDKVLFKSEAFAEGCTQETLDKITAAFEEYYKKLEAEEQNNTTTQGGTTNESSNK